MKIKQNIIHLIQKTEQTIDHLKFWLSPMPTSAGFMDSLQVDMVENWHIPTVIDHAAMIIRYGDLMIRKPLYRWICIPYWETTKIDVKRTIARMSRNGGIR